MCKELTREDVNAIIITNGIISLIKNSQLSNKQLKLIIEECKDNIN